MEHFSKDTLYISEARVKEILKPTKIPFSRVIPYLDDDKHFMIIGLKNKTTNGANEKQNKPKKYYVPVGGKLDLLRQKLLKEGRSIVYIRDKTAAEILGVMLQRTIINDRKTNNGEEVYRYKDMTEEFSKPKGYPTGIDMMFRPMTVQRTNGRREEKNFENLKTDDDMVRFALNRFKDNPYIKAIRTNSMESVFVPEIRFVIAKTATMVANASKTMNGDMRFEFLINSLKNTIKSMGNNPSNANRKLKDDLENRIRQIKRYNINGERLKIIIIPGVNSYQSLDIQAVRHIHVIDSIHQPGVVEQIEGRASRGFGHLLLKKSDRRATIHFYRDLPPKNFLSATNNQKYPIIAMKQAGSQVPRLKLNKTTTESRLNQHLVRMFGLNLSIEKNQSLLQYISEKFMKGFDFVFHHQERLYTHPNRQKIKGNNNRTLTSLTPGNLTVNTLMRTHRNQHPNHLRIEKLYKNMKNIARENARRTT
jgi:hypothetical protein